MIAGNQHHLQPFNLLRGMNQKIIELAFGSCRRVGMVKHVTRNKQRIGLLVGQNIK